MGTMSHLQGLGLLIVLDDTKVSHMWQSYSFSSFLQCIDGGNFNSANPLSSLVSRNPKSVQLLLFLL